MTQVMAHDFQELTVTRDRQDLDPKNSRVDKTVLLLPSHLVNCGAQALFLSPLTFMPHLIEEGAPPSSSLYN